ncbi:hypothetical protein [Methanosarcina horonobensis]|nr:hypothetical protein [Methanosarcina horonobensis]
MVKSETRKIILYLISHEKQSGPGRHTSLVVRILTEQHFLDSAVANGN